MWIYKYKEIMETGFKPRSFLWSCHYTNGQKDKNLFHYKSKCCILKYHDCFMLCHWTFFTKATTTTKNHEFSPSLTAGEQES